MNIHRETKVSLEWNYSDSSFQAEIINGNISNLSFCQVGVTDECNCLKNTDIKYLKQVHEALGQLFKKIDEERKELGHEYATDEKAVEE